MSQDGYSVPLVYRVSMVPDTLETRKDHLVFEVSSFQRLNMYSRKVQQNLVSKNTANE